MLHVIEPIYDKTCSADCPVDNAITFALTPSYFAIAKSSGKKLVVYVPVSMSMVPNGEKCKKIVSDNPLLDFIKIHNSINSRKEPKAVLVSLKAKVHKKANIGNDGMRYVKDKNRLISMKHMGGVKIKDYAEIGPFSTVARATLDWTEIGYHVRIGCGVQIGHNCKIGNRTIIVDGAIIGGSVKIDNDVWVGLNATVRNGISVVSGVFIGMGAVVTKDITEPGTYMGIPARRIGDWDGSF